MDSNVDDIMLVCCLYYLEENGEIFSASDKWKKARGTSASQFNFLMEQHLQQF